MRIRSMGLALMLLLSSIPFISSRVAAQSATAGYPSMAPPDQYRMGREAEISLARNPPESFSGKAESLILTRQGFETVVKGTNGFVCRWSDRDPPTWRIRTSGIPNYVLQFAITL